MAISEKKILHEYFDAIQSGKKTYELRLGDFDVAEGDTLVLREWDAGKQEYTGREISKQVTYVRKFKIDELYWPKESRGYGEYSPSRQLAPDVCVDALLVRRIRRCRRTLVRDGSPN
jgi:hypothetical protein